MKKSNLSVFLILLIFFVACQSNETSNGNLNQEPILEELTGNLEETGSNVDLESIFYLTSNHEGILLVDLTTGKLLESHILEEHIGVSSTFDFNNGYYGALVGNLNQDDLAFRGLIDFDDRDWEIGHDYQYKFLIFDQSLNLLETLQLNEDSFYTGPANFSHMVDIVTFENGELEIYFLPSRVNFDSAGNVLISDYSIIQKYNVHTSEGITLFEIEAELQEIVKIDHEKFFFTGFEPSGQIIDGIEVMQLTYGTINVATGETNIQRSDFQHHEIVTTDNHILLTQRDFRWDVMELGNTVLIFNLLTKDSELITLKEGDSLHPRFSQDETYIATISYDGAYFRKYDLTNGDLVYEQSIDDFDELFMIDNIGHHITPIVFSITDSTYAIHLFTGLGFYRFHQLITIP